jgi:hypothetical protein
MNIILYIKRFGGIVNSDHHLTNVSITCYLFEGTKDLSLPGGRQGFKHSLLRFLFAPSNHRSLNSLNPRTLGPSNPLFKGVKE